MKPVFFAGITALLASALVNAYSDFRCGNTVECKNTGPGQQKCEMQGGNPSWFRKDYPRYSEGTREFPLVRVTAVTYGTIAMGECWYSSKDYSVLLIFRTMSGVHSVGPSYFPNDGWRGPDKTNLTCDPSTYPCYLHAIY